MARPTPDPAGSRIAVLGAASPAGAHLKAALADRGVSGDRVALFGLQREVAVLSEYDGEARLVQIADELDAADYGVVFVCEAGHAVSSLVEAAASGTLVIDLAGSIPSAVLTGVSGAETTARLVAVPHSVTTLLVSLLAPIQRAIGVARVSAHVMRPASDFGEAGLEELREQTVHLLRFEPTPTRVFGRQLAFNLLPEHLFPSEEHASAARIVRESTALLGTPDLPFALSQALVPLFFGHAIAAHIVLSQFGRDEALAAWREEAEVAMTDDPETGATLDAPEGPGLLIARVDPIGDSTLRVWALGSEAGATAAARAIAAAASAGLCEPSVNAPYELLLALRYLRVHRGRTFLSVITMISVGGVAVGTAALVIALALMTGFEEDMRQRILRGSAHLQIIEQAEPGFDDADAVMAKARAVPGVAAAAPVLYSPAMIMNDAVGSPAYAEIYGVDPQLQEDVVDFGVGAGRDPLAGLEQPGGSGRAGIVLGADLASRMAVRPGDLVRLLVPKVRLTPFAPIPRSLVLEVAGVVKTDAYPQDAQRAYVALDVARRLLDAHGRASWVELRLTDPHELGAMKLAVSSAMGERFVVLDLLEQNKEIFKAFETEKLFLFIAIALIVVVASLNIVSTLVLMVNDKVREIGTLTAMGARPVGIASVFMLQGIVIGLVGTAAGLALGSILAYWLDTFRVMKLNPDVYFIAYVPFSNRPENVAIVGLCALVIAFCATIYPALKAASLHPVEAIRHE